MLDKRSILREFIQKQEEKIKQMTESLNGTRRDINEAPGSNVSHSDTMRSQHSDLALGMERAIFDANKVLVVFSNLLSDLDNNPVVCNGVCEGSLFFVKNTGSGETNAYFVVSEGGGVSIEVEGKRIMTVSLSAPIVGALIGRRKGDKTILRGKNLEVIDIQ